jgi:hypothetical protein
MPKAAHLREKAEYCRRMAGLSLHPDVRAQLLGFAVDYDADAARLDLAAGDKPAVAEI